MESSQEPKSVLNIPTAIVIAGAIIAGAIIYMKAPTVANNTNTIADSFEQQFTVVSATDHIFGNPTAKIKIVEYSDTSCPFCKVFHSTMRTIMNDYGVSGNVAWVYRSYPLDTPDANGNILHPNSNREAQALECAGSLGGNEKFWAYTNRLYEITPSVTNISPKGLDQAELPKIAKFVGLNVTDFENCLATGKFNEKVKADFLSGVNIGVQGTPNSILVLNKAFPTSVKEKIMQIYEPYKDENGIYPIRLSADSKMVMLEGAMPLEVVKATIDLLFTY